MTYDQLVEYSEQIYTELRRRIRAQAKANIRKMLEPKETPLETKVRLKRIFRENQQAKRDRIVERAKKDVEELRRETFSGNLYDVHDPDGPKNPFRCEVEYVISIGKRTIVALLRGKGSGRIRAKGIAKCAPDDCFNVHIGKAIALRRALGLEVPAEYLNAPQPTEVRVGDVINYGERFREVVADICEYKIGENCVKASVHAKYGKIFDDSREGVTQ